MAARRGNNLVRLALFAAICALAAGCRPSPCVSCRALLFKGAPIRAYLSTHPAPWSVKKAPNGDQTYIWIFREAEEIPVPAGPGRTEGAGEGQPSNGLSVVYESLLNFLAWLKTKESLQRPAVSSVNQVFYCVNVTTDASGLVKAWSCDSVTVNVGQTRMH
jgi:hypothetical protein